MRLKCQTIVVLCYAVLSTADQEFSNKVTKVWNLSSAPKGDNGADENASSAAKVILSSNNNPDLERMPKISQNFKPYAFRPRTVASKKPEQPPQEKSVYYTQDNKYKTEILFPGNYFPIPKQKSVDSARGSSYNPLGGGPFEPKVIPLIRDQSFKKRSLDVDVQPVEDDSEQNMESKSELEASRRSLSCKYTKYHFFLFKTYEEKPKSNKSYIYRSIRNISINYNI